MIQSKPDYFLAIVETGSITKAAEQLYISQPSLSQYLKRLESNLGIELFERSQIPMKLTYAGQRYYEHIKQATRMEENLLKEFRDIQNQTAGDLRVAIAIWRGACLLPDIFPEFHRRYPNIHLKLREGTAAKMEHALKNDLVDFAIINHYLKPNDLDLTYELIYRERILIALPKNHPVTINALQSGKMIDKYPAVKLDVLNGMPLFFTKSGQGLTNAVNDALSANHVQANILLESENLTTCLNLASRGLGCSFIPEEGSKVCHTNGNIVYCALDADGFEWDLSVAYRRDLYLPRIARLFIDCMKEQLKQ